MNFSGTALRMTGVVRGCEGFGASSRIHTSRILSLSEDLPVLIIMIDQPGKRARRWDPPVRVRRGGRRVTCREQ